MLCSPLAGLASERMPMVVKALTLHILLAVGLLDGVPASSSGRGALEEALRMAGGEAASSQPRALQSDDEGTCRPGDGCYASLMQTRAASQLRRASTASEASAAAQRSGGAATSAAASSTAAEALRVALAMRPSEVAKIDILSMSKTAASVPLTTVEAARFPETVWRGCRQTDSESYQHLHRFLNRTSRNIWRDGAAPVVLEDAAEACLADSRPTAKVPVLTWVASVPPDRCLDNASAPSGNAPVIEEGRWPGLARYFVMWPANNACQTKPCAVTVHMHGMVDMANDTGYPNLVARNSVCASELGTILLSPEMRMPITGDLSRELEGPWTLTGTILPLVEAFLQNNSKLIDFSRIYVTGLSSGAGAALSMALLRPDIFAMAVATDLRFLSVEYLVGVVKQWSKFKKPLRLLDVVLTEGVKDIFYIMDIQDNYSHYFLTNVTTLLQETNLTDLVNVHVRMYEGIAHGTWNAVWMQWPDLYSIMFAGKQVLQPSVPWAAWARQLAVLAALALLVAVWRRAPAAAAAATAPPAATTLAAAASVADKPVQPGSSAAVGGWASPRRLDVRPPLPTPVPASSEAAYTLHSIFEESAAKRPNELCLKMVGHRGLTYGEVQAAVDRCAAHVAALDDKLIGICAHRSYEMMIAIIGTLRTGKAYVPVEPEWPAVRVELIFSTAEVQHVLVPRAQHPLDALASSTSRVALLLELSGAVHFAAGGPMPSDARRIPDSVPDDAPAYVMFTSGSTGKPKGCVVPHRGSAIYSRHAGQIIQLEGGRTMAFKVPFVFDPSVRDIFMCMFAGKTLAIAPPGAHVEARELIDFIVQERVGYTNFAPTLLVEFINHLRAHPRDLAALRPVLRFATCGGEALLSSSCLDLRELLPDMEILNVYGPTECSIDTSHFRATPPMMGASTVVPIGYPHPHIVYKVFDPEHYEGRNVEPSVLRPVPDGKPGELFIGGDCLALGYLGEPEKTAAVFFNFPEVVARPPRAASKYSLYKTGDLVLRRESDGACEFLGRVDFQVKVHGVRIECEEVSAVIKTHAEVNDAFVTKFEGPDGDALVAYVIPASGSSWSLKAAEGAFELSVQQASNETLAKHLATTHLLPVMHPSVYVLMRQLPLNTTGKIDRKALPDPTAQLRLMKTTGVEVVDSLGRVRKIRTEAEAVYSNVMLTVLTLNCLGIILCHWLPTDITWVEPTLSPGIAWTITFLQQASNFNFLALFVLLGYRTRRQSNQDTRDDMVALLALCVFIGFPYWIPELFAGMGTYHRYTCVSLLACHLVLQAFLKLKVPAGVQGMLVFILTLVIGSYPVSFPFIPEGSTSLWRNPGLLLLEPHFNGSWGLQLTMVQLFLMGYHGAIVAENRIRAFFTAAGPLKRSFWRALAGVLFFLLVLMPVRRSSESLATTSSNMYISWDVMGCVAYRAWIYPLNLFRWVLTLLSMLAVFGEGHWTLHAVGRNFVGVYLIHVYFSLDLLGMVRGLQALGAPLQLAAVIAVPALYCLSVGALAQDAVAAVFRGLLSAQDKVNELSAK